jgi:hypothetical protein
VGVNGLQDAVCPTLGCPDLLKTLSGANKCAVRIDKGETPPAEAFWSITMYDKNHFFVPNPINCYTVRSRNRFKTNPDGSIDLYIQRDLPGKDKEQKLLPGPADEFVLMVRMYCPKETPRSIDPLRSDELVISSHSPPPGLVIRSQTTSLPRSLEWRRAPHSRAV